MAAASSFAYITIEKQREEGKKEREKKKIIEVGKPPEENGYRRIRRNRR